jgi:hypothetical protein
MEDEEDQEVEEEGKNHNQNTQCSFFLHVGNTGTRNNVILFFHRSCVAAFDSQ